MSTEFPFPLPTRLHDRLPPARADGLHYVDVCVRGNWDGILVVNADGECAGVYVRRSVIEYPLAFDGEEIEDVRGACLTNRLLASIPFELLDASVVVVLFVSPVALALAMFVHPAFASVTIIVCPLGIAGMYQVRGFPLIRLPAALFGIGQTALAVLELVRWIRGRSRRRASDSGRRSRPPSATMSRRASASGIVWHRKRRGNGFAKLID